MKTLGGLLSLALLVASAFAIDQGTLSDVLVTQGYLTRTGKAGNVWTLEPSDPPTFRQQKIVRITFIAQVGSESRFYAPFEGKYVELSGAVKYVFEGKAALTEIRTIGIVESPAEVLKAGAPDVRSEPGTRVPYKHAYYLFLDRPSMGCERCYVPLLVTQRPLEEIATGTDIGQGVLMFTYERNSIWEVKGAMPIVPNAVEGAPRIIHALGKMYRYQEISMNEMVNLLEHPTGTIAISRPMITNKVVPGARLSDLLQDFRALLRTDN